MLRPISELELVLEQLISEHVKLLKHLDAHQAAIKSLDMRTLEEATRLQEASRTRIAALEARRRALTSQIALVLKLPPNPNLSAIASADPQHRVRLLDLRLRLRDITQRVSSRATVIGRLAGSLLGHLNSVVRILAGAVAQAGLYTRDGVPRVSSRIGVMEAVG